MKKVLGFMAGLVFAGFGLGVLGLLMTLTYGALQKLFPNSFTNQMWGLVVFDIASMAWALGFVFKSKSIQQYGAAGTGFVLGFAGTSGMVAVEVMYGGQQFVKVDPIIGQWMVYGFVVVTVLHALLIYVHHAGAPEIKEQIEVGIARGEVVTQAINDATKQLDQEKALLSRSITQDIVSQVKRDLGLYPVAGTPFDLSARQHPAATDMPLEEQPNFFKNPRAWLEKKFGRDQSGTRVHEQAIPQILDLKELAANSSAMVAWKEMPDGSRARRWCKYCLEERKPAFTPEPCIHVLNAEPELQISDDETVRMIMEIFEEEFAKQTLSTIDQHKSSAFTRQSIKTDQVPAMQIFVQAEQGSSSWDEAARACRQADLIPEAEYAEAKARGEQPTGVNFR